MVRRDNHEMKMPRKVCNMGMSCGVGRQFVDGTDGD